MKIVLAEHFGMCFGVRDALAQAEQLAEQAPLTILGELVHNPIVRERLRAVGVDEGSLDRLDVASGTVMITAHGASDAKRARWRGPWVPRCRWNVSARSPRPRTIETPRRDRVLPCGYREAWARRGSWTDRRFSGRKRGRSCGRHFKTPTSRSIRRDFSNDTADRAGARACNRNRASTSCKRSALCRHGLQAHKDRQSALRKLIDVAEALVVVGGRESNNTRQLVESCRAAGRQAFHIERPDELQRGWFESIETVGLTAGTSTMRETVDAVFTRLQEISSTKQTTIKQNELTQLAALLSTKQNKSPGT